MRASYGFRRSWTVAAPVDTVRDVLVDLERYPEWWPQVLAVAKLTDDDARVLCRSTLPYTLDVVLHAVRRQDRLLEIAMTGDLSGTALWELTPEPGGTRLDFRQDVVVDGWLAALTPLLRPVLRWNHERMMTGCLDGLRARVA